MTASQQPPFAEVRDFVNLNFARHWKVRRRSRLTLMDPANGVTNEPVTTASVQLWDSVVAAGFSEFGPLPENTFAPSATVPQSLNFLA
jgi:hypothetical protein